MGHNRMLRCSERFFLKETSTTSICTLSLHDALPILLLIKLEPAIVDQIIREAQGKEGYRLAVDLEDQSVTTDRKSTRLNSSHSSISYAVFCLKKTIKRRSALMCTHILSSELIQLSH